MSILAAENISVSLKGRKVLTNINVVVQVGELLGLLGPNGAGKTTLLKALAGLRSCSGRTTVDGRDVASLSPDERAKRIAYLPQGTEAHWPMPVKTVVGLGRLPYQRHFAPPSEADRAAIARAMAEADIGALADRRLNALSGGELARVFLARALAVEAPVLLADEPVTHLDPGHQLAVLDVLARRASDGDAVVVVLHDLGLAARYCHRVCVLDNGHLVAEGTPDQVLDDALLDRVYGIRAARGIHDGHAFLLPWEVSAR
ncbi:ABC transporter ATP-binding protein [Telmatospirillum sp.]|uniref:ABC transporter ATP-binding protein n=1 Tax=Telmatospirillum sp. TaxID=2079197 RepID=UPI002849D9BC|nr:ABC transporter ATP-binding protein [Telmatospirillum sp.]MDR3435634.1 ABC transporter ATP-binding protein [Telmatospirillum sp.]